MDQQRIKQLIDLVAASDLGELTLSEGGTTLTLVRHGSASAPVAAVSPAAATPVTPAVAVPAARVPAPAQPAAATQASGDVNSPLYGILHLTPSPDEPAFVAIGATVTEGQTLCIVEAMKMFHQVRANRAGQVEAILATAGDEVESGQPLFRIV
jgi:acetyl-CoA carboxylase biotin carboxyl carrier protein